MSSGRTAAYWALLLGFIVYSAVVHAVPTFHNVGSNEMCASPSGRYLAVLDRPNDQAGSVWVCALSTGHWRRLMTGIYGVATLHWSVDERAVLMGVSPTVDPKNTKWNPWKSITIWRIPLAGKPIRLTRLSRGVDWLPFSQGNIVATAIDPRIRKLKVGEDVRALVMIYSVVTHRWRRIARTPWVYPDSWIGDHPALRRHGRDWVLSCHECGPADSRSFWVNLTTGHGVLAEEGDPLFQYAPNGRYVLAEGNLYAAYTWPLASRWYDLVRETLLVSHVDGPWAPDSRHLMNIQYERTYNADDRPTGYRILTLVNLTYSTLVPLKNVIEIEDIQWVGPAHVLLIQRQRDHHSNVMLTDLSGSGSRLLFLVM